MLMLAACRSIPRCIALGGLIYVMIPAGFSWRLSCVQGLRRLWSECLGRAQIWHGRLVRLVQLADTYDTDRKATESEAHTTQARTLALEERVHDLAVALQEADWNLHLAQGHIVETAGEADELRMQLDGVSRIVRRLNAQSVEDATYANRLIAQTASRLDDCEELVNQVSARCAYLEVSRPTKRAMLAVALDLAYDLHRKFLDAQQLRCAFGAWAVFRQQGQDGTRAQLQSVFAHWVRLSSRYSQRRQADALRRALAEMDERLGGDLGELEERIEDMECRLAVSDKDSDEEYLDTCVSIAEAAEAEQRRIESVRCAGCASLEERCRVASVAARRLGLKAAAQTNLWLLSSCWSGWHAARDGPGRPPPASDLRGLELAVTEQFDELQLVRREMRQLRLMITSGDIGFRAARIAGAAPLPPTADNRVEAVPHAGELVTVQAHIKRQEGHLFALHNFCTELRALVSNIRDPHAVAREVFEECVGDSLLERFNSFLDEQGAHIADSMVDLEEDTCERVKERIDRIVATSMPAASDGHGASQLGIRDPAMVGDADTLASSGGGTSSGVDREIAATPEPPATLDRRAVDSVPRLVTPDGAKLFFCSTGCRWINETTNRPVRDPDARLLAQSDCQYVRSCRARQRTATQSGGVDGDSMHGCGSGEPPMNGQDFLQSLWPRDPEEIGGPDHLLAMRLQAEFDGVDF